MTVNFNSTLISMFERLEPNRKRYRKKQIALLVFAYITIIHESTEYPIYELVLERTHRLHIDMYFEISGENRDTMTMYNILGTRPTSHLGSQRNSARIKQKQV